MGFEPPWARPNPSPPSLTTILHGHPSWITQAEEDDGDGEDAPGGESSGRQAPPIADATPTIADATPTIADATSTRDSYPSLPAT